MRRLLINDEQAKALAFAVGDVAEVYEQFKFDGSEAGDDEKEYEGKVRRYGQVLMELFNKELKDIQY